MVSRGRVLVAAALTSFAIALTAIPGAATAATPGLVIAPTWTPIPTYSVAKHDEPITYANGCHVKGVVTTPKVCTFASTGTRTVMLFGDSHANHWFGAVLNAARVGKWKMKTMTKSGCPAVKVSVRRYKSSGYYPECNTWRAKALAGLAKGTYGRVDVLVISSWHFHQVVGSTGRNLTGAAKYARWQLGMKDTLTTALKGVKQIVILRDSPDLPGDMLQAQACYARWGLAAKTKCGTTLAKATSAGIWAAEKKAAAAFGGRVVTVDLTTPTCPNSWCGPIDGPYLAFKDDNHWTQTWVKARMNKPVYAQVKAAILRAG